MEKYLCEGKTYYYQNGKWFDSSYISVHQSMVSKLNKLLDKDKIVQQDFSEACKTIDRAKEEGNLTLALEMSNRLIVECRTWDIQLLLPRITSIYRAIGNPNKAIQVSDEYIEKYGKEVYSPMLFTSIAAAYCDLGDYVKAKEYADRANVMGKTSNESDLIVVYKRIKSKK